MPAAMSASQAEAMAKMKVEMLRQKLLLKKKDAEDKGDSVEAFLATNKTALEVLAQDLARKRPGAAPLRARLTPREEERDQVLSQGKENGAKRNEGAREISEEAKRKKKEKRAKKAGSRSASRRASHDRGGGRQPSTRGPG